MLGKILLDKDWRFHLGDEPDADYMGFDDTGWKSVDLPHDWSVEHPFDRSCSSGTGYLPGGTAWYRKHFMLTAESVGKRVYLLFEGVYRHSRVYINSNHLGGRAYGYSTFGFDVSEFVREGENVISVRVERNETADSRWYTGSGIYRNVYLTVSNNAYFAQNGIFIRTQSVDSDGAAILSAEYETVGCDGAEAAVEDENGAVIARSEASGESGRLELRVENAKLWSPDSPYLYNIRFTAFSGGAKSDEEVIPFGIRTIRFDADKGFFLNGINMKLKGVCVHHDAGALGAAVPPAVWERRLTAFKDAGCNALRTAHNPPDPALLGLCDRLGFLVMDEAFDEWEGAKNKWWQGHNVYPPKRFGYAEDFPLWHRADLEDMIKRDRNHPCVILWSIGNEIDYPNDPYVTPLFDEVLGNNDNGKPASERRYDPKKPDAKRLATVAKELIGIVHSVDTSRPALSAMSFPELSTRTGFAGTLDVWGYNYREKLYEEDHGRFPDKVIFGSENSHSASAWYAVRDNDFICGQFLWTGVDFLGECRGWPVRISQAGMLDLCGFKKPLFYQRKALWSDDPFVKIAVSKGDRENTSVWTDRFVYSGRDGEKTQVSCYTNRGAVELFLNGRSLGKKELAACDGGRAVFEIPFEKGTLKAVTDGAEDVLATPGQACGLKLEPYISGNIAQVEVSLTDEDGNVTDDDRTVSYRLSGGGKILGIENGKPDDLTPYYEPFRATFNGRSVVYIRLDENGGPAALTAAADGGKGRTGEIKSVLSF